MDAAQRGFPSPLRGIRFRLVTELFHEEVTVRTFRLAALAQRPATRS